MNNKKRVPARDEDEENSDDVDNDLAVKDSNKSDTLTEEDDGKESKDKRKDGSQSQSQSEATNSPVSNERRSSRIMTRRQRDSELRLQFAKKLKANATADKGTARKSLPKTRRFSKSDLNTSEDETMSPVKKSVGKKPMLTNKRKSSLEYEKSRKLLRHNADTTTTTDDQSEDTEESDYRNNTSKRKPNQTKNTKQVKKIKQEPSEDETETDEETDSDENLEEDIKKAISKKFTSYKTETPNKSLKNNHTPATPSHAKKPLVKPNLKKPMGSTPGPVKNSMDNTFKTKVVSNVTNVDLYAKTSGSKKIDSIKIYYPNNEKSQGESNKSVTNKPSGTTVTNKKPSTASPRVKSEFDKLVDELFETETKKKPESKPELMMINNEPTDVYTLGIDDTDDEELDENLAALCEEVYEDDILLTKPNNTTIEPHIPHTPPPSLGPNKSRTITNTPHMNNNTNMKQAVHNMNMKQTMNNSSTKQQVNNVKQITNSSMNIRQTTQAKPVTRIPETSSKVQTPLRQAPNSATDRNSWPKEVNIDYKEKYNKLHASYEVLSKKISLYMEKTRKEKEQLKRQLRIEKTRSSKAQEDLDSLRRKFQYLMKNKPSLNKK
ncbi:hypothetical protein M8J77_017416 [Diaphorina citri]|nr:hypothetical protein M8J77_017416 [Diaphorina citri]